MIATSEQFSLRSPKARILSHALRLAVILSWGVVMNSAQSATVIANSPSLADVTSAIQAANDGDTVQIPAGTATWAFQATLNKPITVVGAGTNATIITGQPHCFVISLPSSKANMLVRISNLRLNGSFNPVANGDYIIYALGNINALRVDHVYFHGGQQAVEAGDISSWAYGVIDHCTFEDPVIGVRPQGGNALGWVAPQTPGTTNCICIEDCYFFYSANVNNYNLYTGAWPQEMIYHQWGARSLIRNNVFDASRLTSDTVGGGLGASWCNLIDAHGNQGYLEAGNAEQSTALVECYSNTFKAYHTPIFSGLRGGMHIWHDNSFNNVQSVGAACIRFTEEEGWSCPGSVTDPNFPYCRTSWPAEQQITNSFAWGNTYNGSPVSPVTYSSSDSIFIQQSRDYWTAPPNAANGLPAGVYANYRPLVYPHPLVGGSSAPTSPVLSVSPASHDFGPVPTGSTNDFGFTVQNVGVGTLSGVASVGAPFSIVGPSSYSLGAQQSQVITVRYIPPAGQSGATNQIVTFTGGGGAASTVLGSVVLGTSFNAPAGAISAPFTVNADGTISQSVETLDPTQGGEAIYTFNVPQAGNYVVSMNVFSPNGSSDSLFVNIDAEPVSPDNIWDMIDKATMSYQVATWRLDGTGQPHVWSLSPGVHQLIIRGREAGVLIGAINVLQDLPPSPPSNFHVVGG